MSPIHVFISKQKISSCSERTADTVRSRRRKHAW